MGHDTNVNHNQITILIKRVVIIIVKIYLSVICTLNKCEHKSSLYYFFLLFPALPLYLVTKSYLKIISVLTKNDYNACWMCLIFVDIVHDIIVLS